MSDKHITVTVSLTKEYVEFIDRQVKHRDLNRSQVVRSGLRKLMDEEKAKKEVK